MRLRPINWFLERRRMKAESKQRLLPSTSNRPIYKRSSWSKRTLKSDGSSTSELDWICQKILTEKGITPRKKRRRKHEKCSSSSTSKNDSKDTEIPNQDPPKESTEPRRRLTSEGSSGKLKDLIQELLKNDSGPPKGTDGNSRALKSYIEADTFQSNQMIEKGIQPIETEDIGHARFKVTSVERNSTPSNVSKRKVEKSKTVIENTPLLTEEEITKHDNRNKANIANENETFMSQPKCRYEMEEEEPQVFLSLKKDRRTKNRHSREQQLRTHNGGIMTEFQLTKTGSVSSCSIDSAFEQAHLPPPPPPPRKNEKEWMVVQADDFVDRISESISKWFGLCLAGKEQ